MGNRKHSAGNSLLLAYGTVVISNDKKPQDILKSPKVDNAAPTPVNSYQPSHPLPTLYCSSVHVSTKRAALTATLSPRELSPAVHPNFRTAASNNQLNQITITTLFYVENILSTTWRIFICWKFKPGSTGLSC
ncbi:hypothetical protein PanWU01x14_352690 [Parasponia andersonii]|uniref:Uncharacterized protein n=1 Tax=Parasponia andersonii TaxID=3476 RepID=A0A2P5AA75_PARAD|nr:hypothetical protein PanWU01x14_352690 [Parasponia andersonii]